MVGSIEEQQFHSTKIVAAAASASAAASAASASSVAASASSSSVAVAAAASVASSSSAAAAAASVASAAAASVASSSSSAAAAASVSAAAAASVAAAAATAVAAAAATAVAAARAAAATAQPLVILILCCFSSSLAFPGGGPDIACQTMLPSGHGAKPQQGPPPYRILPTKTSYKPGETISINLEAQIDFFKGIYVQAHSALCSNNDQLPVGVFTSLGREFQTRHCYGIVHSTLTQTNPGIKIKEKIFWTAPVNPVGHVVIKATFVKDVNTFWTNVSSTVIFDLQATSGPQECIQNHTHQHHTNIVPRSSFRNPEQRITEPTTVVRQQTSLSYESQNINAARKNMGDKVLHIWLTSVFLQRWI